ncbi:hypothetical protein MMPV_002310 [Pyropia vietnamensis]
MAPTTVRFTVRAGGSRPGQAVFLVGSAPTTGGWSPEAGVRLSTDAATFPVWCSPPVELSSPGLPLPLVYKYVLAAENGGSGGHVTWEVDGRSAVRTLSEADVAAAASSGAQGGEVVIDDGVFGVLYRGGTKDAAAATTVGGGGSGGMEKGRHNGGGRGIDPAHGGGAGALRLAERPLDALEAAVVAMNGDRRSWRRRLSYVRELFTGDAAAAASFDPRNVGHLATIVVYLTFLTTGQVRCEEDGGHHRPNHHAAEAKAIDEALAALDPSPSSGTGGATDDDGLQMFLLRKIYPLLPSYASQFTVSVPMTRIRNIAHRGDIPHDLKQQIKHTLQNKLHRCAGPEDMLTCERLVEQVTAPGTSYSGAFVAELLVFRDELREFFNATALDDRLQALADRGSDTAGRLMGLKHGWAPAGQQLATLNTLRAELHAAPAAADAADAQAARLTDVELEKYTVTLLAAVAADMEGGLDWAIGLGALAAAATCLALSRVTSPVAEAEAVAAELGALAALDTGGGNGGCGGVDTLPPLLRVRAAVERAVRLVDALCGGIAAVYADRVGPLAAALGVSGPAATVFAEAEVRAHAAFHMARVASVVGRSVRSALGLPPWDAICPGTATGVLVVADTIGEVVRPAGDVSVVAVVARSSGEEDVPGWVRGVVLGHDLPHLSHLGVRARQAGVVFVCADDPAAFGEFVGGNGPVEGLAGTRVVLAVDAGEGRLELTRASEGTGVAAADVASSSVPAAAAMPVEIGAVDASATMVLAAADVTAATGGAKAAAAGVLERLADDSGGFAAPTSVVVPFGVYLAAVDAAASVLSSSSPSLRKLSAAYDMATDAADAAAAAAAVRSWIETATSVPPAVVAAISGAFPAGTLLMVRSSANCEDLAAMSGAGLYDSLAAVPAGDADAVATAVRRVWGSLWSGRAASSRATAGVAHGSAAMAVLVQAMVPAEVSFIGFSRNPVTAASAGAAGAPAEAYLELAIGMGETLASAASRGTPYRATVARDGTVTEAAVASYSVALRPASSSSSSPSADKGGTGGDGLVPIVLDYSTVRLTTDDAYRLGVYGRVARVVAGLEAALGGPQDTEGVLDVDGELYVVQTRPMVAVAGGGD